MKKFTDIVGYIFTQKSWLNSFSSEAKEFTEKQFPDIEM